ncbi:peptidylprolyl isomerase [Rugamonas rubra]|uniref:peptidylprolyl isomerase n=1 Tax=Rugamonas rubra TaxID=758825 RepID=A0A1I4SZG4_9BURK|nr:peptidylprolyl isomerase [Rugamonas rubra]SFM69866.1 PPIC-type PPIASE domain-containing protein [Rugamonas rubra]
MSLAAESAPLAGRRQRRPVDSPRALLGGLLLGLTLAAALPASAEVNYAVRDAALAARVNGAPLHAFALDTAWRLARAKQPQVSRTAVLETLIGERLLAAAARKSYGEAALYSGQRVGFAQDVALDDQLAGSLRGLYGKELEQVLLRLPGGSLNGVVTERPALDGAALDAVFGKPGQLRLELALGEQQQTRAKAIVVLRYALPNGGKGALSLYDIYRRQNVQGRAQLFARQADFVQQQAMQSLAALFVLDWARGRFGAAAVDDLRGVFADQEAVLALQRLHGIGIDTDSGSPLLEQLARQVGAAEVQAYYKQHQEEFVRIERVKARHIRLPDEASAQAVYGELRAGGDFAALARRHSRAADARNGGELGWIKHEGKPDWLAQLAFAQDKGEVSRPVRAPVGPHDPAYWEIVLVEQRVNGVQAADSEAVRYVASNAVAREKALAQLAALRAHVLREARIELNRRVLDQALQLLEKAS